MWTGKRRLTVAAAVVVPTLVAGLTACTTLPGESTPEVVSGYASEPEAGDVPSPTDGQAPDLMLRDFYLASTHPGNNRQSAKDFLTGSAEDGWDDSQTTMILDRLDLNATGRIEDDSITYVVRGTIVGRLGTGGVYQPENTPYEEEVELSRGENGWRITDLPDGVVLDRSDFAATYVARDIYFLDPTKRFLVPDRRWVYDRQDNPGFSLVSLLSGGPRANLEAGVTTSVPEINGVQTSVDEDGTFNVEMTGVADQSQVDREALAAQLVWTLAGSDVRGPYRIVADGTSITDEGREEWNLRDVEDFNPEVVSNEPLQALRDGALVEVRDDTAETLPGWTSSGELESAGVAGSDGRVAAVSGRGDERRTLSVGDPEADPVTLTSARSLSRPSWSGDGQSVYAVADGRELLRYERSGTGIQMDESTVGTGRLGELDIRDPRISVFTVSRDGTRAAMLINGRLFVSALNRDGDSGDVELGTPMEIGQRVGDTALAVDWRDDGSLLVGTRANDAPVWTVAADGSEATPLSTRNITARVVAVASRGSVQYILDDRALMQLDVDDAETRFWREVPALQGARAVPILGR
ncbi:MAG: LpqB family beta-propeller domain-containing protein [Mycobacteriaceae bacterium]|uniref:LpqB family beta-propeller domain-containing protein n=1 Tax=Corynebacterium sp. TaxID=1720 RepID=UPI003F97A25D